MKCCFLSAAALAACVSLGAAMPGMKFSNSFSVQRLPPEPLPGWQARTFISFISPVPAILTLIVSTP